MSEYIESLGVLGAIARQANRRRGMAKERDAEGRVICKAAAIAGAEELERIHDLVAELIAADREFDAANAAWDELDTRGGIGDDKDHRDFDGPEFKRLSAAIARRKAALAAVGGAK